MSLKNLVPLRKVVGASITDTYSDTGRTEHMYYHWASRGLQKLIKESLKLPVQRVLLPVNKNTMTASLPIDFDEEVFVGYIHGGVRVPIFLNRDLVNLDSINTVNSENQCSSCHRDLTIGESLNVTETINSIDINGSYYSETVKKTLLSNGDYWLEKNSPFLDTSVIPNTISYVSSKELITNFDLDKCGCITPVDDNIVKIKRCAPDVYSCYFTCQSNTCSSNEGSYRIFDESGLIQLDRNFSKDKLYLEYTTFMVKVNNEYMVPRVAFETLVSWTKFKSVENRSNIPLSERNWYYMRFKDERANMTRVMGRAKLSTILHSASKIPKFDISN